MSIPRSERLSFSIPSTWDAEPIPDAERVEFVFAPNEMGLAIDIRSPYYDEPMPRVPVGPCWGLWEFEVVEIFVAGRDGAYTEIELGPHGHHLILRFKEPRRPWAQELPLDYRASIQHSLWSGKALVPWSYLPPAPHRINLYAIHGLGAGRRYLALQPVPGEQPDFHQLDFFKAISFGKDADGCL